MSSRPQLIDSPPTVTRQTEADGVEVPLSPRTVVARRHSRRDWWTRRALASADGAGLLVAFFVTQEILLGRAGVLERLAWFAPAVAIWVVVFRAYGLYEGDIKRLNHSTLDDIPVLFQAILLGSLGLWAYFRIGPTRELIAEDVLVFASCSFVTVLTCRILIRWVLRWRLGPARALLVGADPTTGAFMRKLRAHPEYRLEPVGVVGSEPDQLMGQVAPIEDVDGLDIETVIRQRRIDHVVISHSALEEDVLFELIQVCKSAGTRISLLPQLSDALGPALEVDDVAGLTVLGLHPPVLPRWSRSLKRGMDVALSGAMLLGFLPVLLVAAVVLKLDSSGPVFFRQKRIGKDGQPFELVKFRTMVVDAEARVADLFVASEDPHWLKLEHDPRITRFGRLLRQSSLDELPQLWNVLRGRMSLVGPRPLPEQQDRLIGGWGRGRLDLTPGITGLWQVLGRANIPFEEMLKLDYLYVTNWSLWNDIRLILRTVPAVLRRRGAN